MRLQGETGGTADDRRSEADKIVAMLEGFENQMEPKEQRFILNCSDGRDISPAMIFWLRDIKDKYL